MMVKLTRPLSRGNDMIYTPRGLFSSSGLPSPLAQLVLFRDAFAPIFRNLVLANFNPDTTIAAPLPRPHKKLSSVKVGVVMSRF